MGINPEKPGHIFPPMRRRDRALQQAETEALLQNGEWGLLASADAGGLPLATPLSYVWMDGCICFHCALEGHKMRNLAQNPKVCFCVVGATQPVYDNDFSTYYESAVVHGSAEEVQDEAERRAILLALCKKYLPDHMDKAMSAIEKMGAVTAVVRITPEHITGKAKKQKH